VYLGLSRPVDCVSEEIDAFNPVRDPYPFAVNRKLFLCEILAHQLPELSIRRKQVVFPGFCQAGFDFPCIRASSEHKVTGTLQRLICLEHLRKNVFVIEIVGINELQKVEQIITAKVYGRGG
jgi:hypothetical protein